MRGLRERGDSTRDYTGGMTARLRAVLCFFVLALALAGCGNKGDLVLPDAPEPEAPAEAPPAR